MRVACASVTQLAGRNNERNVLGHGAYGGPGSTAMWPNSFKDTAWPPVSARGAEDIYVLTAEVATAPENRHRLTAG
jgi:hypothetical protein